MHNTPKYYATKFLIQNGIEKLPITTADVKSQLKELGCRFKSYDLNNPNDIEDLKAIQAYELAKDKQGFTYANGERKIVFYQCCLSNEELRLLFAHEQAHFVLGHFSSTYLLGYHVNNAFLNDKQEIEAEEFTLEFLAPTCILKKCHVKTASDISKLTLLDTSLSERCLGKMKSAEPLTIEEITLQREFNQYLLLYKNENKRKLGTLIIIAVVMSIIFYFAHPYINNPPKEGVITTQSEDLPQTSNTPVIRDEKIENLYYWTAKGTSYHSKSDCAALKRASYPIQEGILERAFELDKKPCKLCIGE